MTARIMGYDDFVSLGNNELLTPAELGRVFKVDPKTVTRWSKAGKLDSIRTIGGHRRYRKIDVLRAMTESEVPDGE